MEFKILDTLCENPMFRQQRHLDEMSADKQRDCFYLYVLAVYLLSKEDSSWTSNYCSRTVAYNNFDYFRVTNTDLYMLSHAVFDKQHIKVNELIYRTFLKDTGHKQDTSQYFDNYLLVLERALNISDYRYKSLRRVSLTWDEMYKSQKADILQRLYFYIRQYSILAEILPEIKKYIDKYREHSSLTEAMEAIDSDARKIEGILIGIPPKDEFMRDFALLFDNIKDDEKPRDLIKKLATEYGGEYDEKGGFVSHVVRFKNSTMVIGVHVMYIHVNLFKVDKKTNLTKKDAVHWYAIWDNKNERRFI